MERKVNLTQDVDLGALGYQEIDFVVSYTPRVPGKQYDAGGDPGSPPEAATIEVISAHHNGRDVSFLPWDSADSILCDLLEEIELTDSLSYPSPD